MPCRSRRSAARSKCSPPTASRRGCSATTATRRRRSFRAPSWSTTATQQAPRADGIVITPSHNPPRDGGIKYNPPHGGPADTDATGWIEQRANALMHDGNRGVRRLPYAQALAAADDRAGRFRRSLRRRSGRRHRHGSDPPGRPEDRRRSARRRGRGLLEADRRELRPEYRGGESEGRSGLRLHDAGPRRQDPHGLLQPLRHGQPGQAEGSFRHRLGQRRRRRPARHRHAVARPAEPEPLPGRRHPLPADPPAAMAGSVQQSARRWCRAA